MTRLSITHDRPHTPVSVLLGELAIAAGIAGKTLAICYRDYPAHATCRLWKRICRSLSAEQVYSVRTAAEVRKIRGHVDTVRAVQVLTARLHNSVNWALQLAETDGASPRPAVFTAAPPADLDKDPGATIMLQGSVAEIRMIEDWLLRENNSTPDWSVMQPPTDLECDAQLRPILQPDNMSRLFDNDRLQNQQILDGLLAGAYMLRSSRGSVGATTNAMVNMEDYELVRRLLQTQVISPVDELCDSLTLDMLNRANVYLSVKYGPDSVERNPFYADDYDRYVHSRGGPPRKNLVTAREIVDLGNTRSRTLRRLIEYLKDRTDDHEAFQRMCPRRHWPTRDEWRRLSTEELIARLRSWTPKQARSRLDHLRKTNLISAERQQSNGPWLYVLPEEFSVAASPFRRLPSANELSSHRTDEN